MSHRKTNTYDVVLLVEQVLTGVDAEQVTSLHEAVEEPVHYHLLLPVDNAAARIESGIGALGAGEAMAAPGMVMAGEDVEELQEQLSEQAREDIDASVELLRRAGAARAGGEPVTGEPIQALADKVADVDAREAIILTRSHVISEFFHLDWSSRARRKLGVPVLHLLEHETFDEQAEDFGEEGATGF